MFTSNIVQTVKKDIEDWTINFVEASNVFYGGKFPVCPYARQARIKGETTYAIYSGGGVKKFIEESVQKLLQDKKHKQMLIVLPARTKWYFGQKKIIHNLNKKIIPQNYFALDGNAKGTKSNYTGIGNSGEYRIIGVNTLDEVLDAVEYLKKSGYYKDWSKEHYYDIVIRRQEMYEKYSNINVKGFYNNNNFPGKYSADAVKTYYNKNRYLSFIQKYIVGRFTVLDAGCGTGFTTNLFAYDNPGVKFTGVDFADSIDWAEKISNKLNLENVNFIKKIFLNFIQNFFPNFIQKFSLNFIQKFS